MQHIREGDVRTLHKLQRQGQRLLVRPSGNSGILRRLTPIALRILLSSPVVPLMQRRIFFGAPLPPIDPGFAFRETA